MPSRPPSPGTTIGQTYAGARTVDTVVILPPAARNRLDELETLMVGNSETRALLRNVATIKLSQGRSNIQHEGAQRRVAVTFNGDDSRSLQDVVSDVRERVEKLGAAEGRLPVVRRPGRGGARRPDPPRHADRHQHASDYDGARAGLPPPGARRPRAHQSAVLPDRLHGGDRGERHRA